MLTYPYFKQKQILFVLLSYGEKLSFKNDNIIVTGADDKIKHQSTCYKLFVLFVVGHITITSGLLQRAEKFGFSIIMLSHSFKFVGIWASKTEGNVLLRQKQYSYDKLDIALHIVRNKIKNQMLVLQTIRKRSDDANKTIIFLQEQLKTLQGKQIVDLQYLLGIEGVCSRVYFKSLYEDCNWHGRKPRVKSDIVNCLLDIGYTILFNIVDALLKSYGFDVYKGVYHTNFYQRKSLACDLEEPFRPLIDMRIRKAYNLNQIDEKNFSIIQNQYRLFGEESKSYVLWLLEPILENKKEIFLYIQGYYRAFIRDKKMDEYPVFYVNK